MTGVTALLGAPLSPWQVLQTRSLAPRIASASAVFPTVATAGTSGMCPAGCAAFSSAFAGMASAATTARAPETVEKRLLVMFTPPLFEGTQCSRVRSRVTLPTRHSHLKHAAVRLVAQDVTISLVQSGGGNSRRSG